MSLINQVLKDIDERRSAEHSENKTDLDDLHFAHIPKRKSKTKPVIITSIASLSVVAMVVVGIFVLRQVSPIDSESQQLSEVSDTGHTVVAEVTAPVRTQERSAKENRVQPKAKTKPRAVKPAAKVVVTDAVRTRETRVVIEEESETAVALSSKTELAAEAGEELDDSPVKFTRSNVPMRPEQKAELSYQNGYDHLRAKRHRKAEQSLRQALVAESSHVKARELLSGIYIKQGRWIEASELLRDGLTYTPEHLTFSKLYARALMQLNQDAKAITILKKYAPAVNSDPNYFAILAALYQRQNQHGHAADVYAKLVSINPNKGVWWVGLGISLEALGRQQDALQAYAHARKTGNLHNEVARFTNNRLVALEEINFPSD